MKHTTLVCAALVTLVPSIALAEPLLRYTFDEASGIALDSGDAPSANGTLIGGATRSASTPSGYGASIDLRDDDLTHAYVLTEDASAKLEGLNALTLSTWLNLEAYFQGNNRLVAKQNGANFGGFSWNMNATPNSGNVGADNFRLGIFLGNNTMDGSNGFTSGFSTNDVDAHNKWIFLAVTYDGTQAINNTKFYIGSTSTHVAQLGNSLTLTQMIVDSGGAPFGIGYTHAAPGADYSAIGLQDDIRVYGRALTQAELEVVRGENVVPEPSLLPAILLGIACIYWLTSRRALNFKVRHFQSGALYE